MTARRAVGMSPVATARRMLLLAALLGAMFLSKAESSDTRASLQEEDAVTTTLSAPPVTTTPAVANPTTTAHPIRLRSNDTITSITCYVAPTTGQVLGIATTTGSGATVKTKHVCSNSGAEETVLLLDGPITSVAVSPLGRGQFAGVASLTVTTLGGRKHTCGGGANQQNLPESSPAEVASTPKLLQDISAKCGITKIRSAATADSSSTQTSVKTVKGAIKAASIRYSWITAPEPERTDLIFEMKLSGCPPYWLLREMATALEQDVKAAGATEVTVLHKGCWGPPLPSNISTAVTDGYAESSGAVNVAATVPQAVTQWVAYLKTTEPLLPALELCASSVDWNKPKFCSSCLPSLCSLIKNWMKQQPESSTELIKSLNTLWKWYRDRDSEVPGGSYRQTCSSCGWAGYCGWKCQCQNPSNVGGTTTTTWDICTDPCYSFSNNRGQLECDFSEVPGGSYQASCQYENELNCDWNKDGSNGYKTCTLGCRCNGDNNKEAVVNANYDFCTNWCPSFKLWYTPQYTLECQLPDIPPAPYVPPNPQVPWTDNLPALNGDAQQYCTNCQWVGVSAENWPVGNTPCAVACACNSTGNVLNEVYSCCTNPQGSTSMTCSNSGLAYCGGNLQLYQCFPEGSYLKSCYDLFWVGKCTLQMTCPQYSPAWITTPTVPTTVTLDTCKGKLAKCTKGLSWCGGNPDSQNPKGYLVCGDVPSKCLG